MLGSEANSQSQEGVAEHSDFEQAGSASQNEDLLEENKFPAVTGFIKGQTCDESDRL